jgi:hypothetical protein
MGKAEVRRQKAEVRGGRVTSHSLARLSHISPLLSHFSLGIYD